MAKGLPIKGEMGHLSHRGDPPVFSATGERWDMVNQLAYFPETTSPLLGIRGSPWERINTYSFWTHKSRLREQGIGNEE